MRAHVFAHGPIDGDVCPHSGDQLAGDHAQGFIAQDLDRAVVGLQRIVERDFIVVTERSSLTDTAIELSASGQLAMRRVLEEHLKRVEWGYSEVSRAPLSVPTVPRAGEERHIAIDPRIAFGRPVVSSRGISTSAITGRVDAGESVENIADDYELDPPEIEQAVVYEQAA